MKHFLVLSIVLFFNTHAYSFAWDSKHFAKYTSNALANTALVAFFCWNAHCAYKGMDQEELGSVIVPGSIAATTVYIGYEKCKHNKEKHPDTTILKTALHTYSDIALLLLMGISSLLDEKNASVGLACSLTYLGKYSYFNRLRPVVSKKDID